MVKLLALLVLALHPSGSTADVMTAEDLALLRAPPPDHRIAYGAKSLHFGHLRLPRAPGPHPVIVLIHGGCWLAEYDIAHLGELEQTLADAGHAVWSIEYRRVGDEGGGWPGTYQDVGAAIDHLRSLAPAHELDLTRVVVSGHSAGGALALWAAARARMPPGSELYVADPLPVGAVVALAPAADLEAIERRDSCDDVMNRLMGGTPAERPERYRVASPMQLTPIGIPQFVVFGAHDHGWKPTGQAYFHRALAVGDPVEAFMLDDAGHFEMIAPRSRPWPSVLEVYARAFDALAAPVER